MNYITLFTGEQIKQAFSANPQGSLKSDKIGINNAKSWSIINNSPFFLKLTDDNNNVIGEISPWNSSQDTFERNVNNVIVQNDLSLPVLNFGTNEQFGIQLGFTVIDLIKQSTNTIQVTNINSEAAQVSLIGTASVNVANTPEVNANIQGTANVQIQGTPQVDITGQTIVANVSNAGFEADVINAKIGTNDLIPIGHNKYTIVNLANNASILVHQIYGTIYMSVGELGIYDGAVVMLYAHDTDQLLQLTQLWLYTTTSSQITAMGAGDTLTVPDFPVKVQNANKLFCRTQPMFFQAMSLNAMAITLKNISGAVYNGDVELWFFAIKAGISNPASVPANMIYGQGSYDTPTYINYTPAAGGTYTLVAAGGYFTKIYLNINNFSGAQQQIDILNGSNTIDVRKIPANTTDPVSIDFTGSGIYNAGLKVAVVSNQISFKGFVSTSVDTPRSVVSTIV